MSLTFSGNAATNFLTIASNARYTVASGTVGGWMKTTFNNSGANGSIFWRVSGSNTGGFIMLQSGSGTNTLELAAWDTAGTLQLDIGDSGGIDLHNGKWHHVVAVFDTANGATNSIYVDGALRKSGTSAAAWPMSNQALTWGAAGSGQTTNAESVADWFFSSAKLTALEIKGIAQGERLWGLRGGLSWWPIFGRGQSPEPDFIGGTNIVLNGSPSFDYDPPYSMFTPRWHQFAASMAPLAGLGWVINRRNKLMVRK